MPVHTFFCFRLFACFLLELLFIKQLQMTKLSNDINLNDLSNGAEKHVRWLKAAFLGVMSHSFPV